jgi:hypothetical protein
MDGVVLVDVPLVDEDADSTDLNPVQAVAQRTLLNIDDYPVVDTNNHPADAVFAEYVPFKGAAGPDPRTVNIGPVADGLCAIIEAEGPMIAKRAYDTYLRGCGIRRLGGELKSTMNKALGSAIRQGRVISENEPGKSGFILSTVRAKGADAVRLRLRGPRTFEEIPPSELRAAGKYLAQTHDLEPGSDEHLRAILECFDLKRLTTQAGTTILEVLDRKTE